MSDYNNIGLELPASFSIEEAKQWSSEEYFYSYFEDNSISLLSAIDILIKVDTILSMYVLIRILCVESIISRFGWEPACREDINNLSNDYLKFRLYRAIKPNLLCVINSGILAIHKLTEIPIKDLPYADFLMAFERYAYRKRKTFSKGSLPYVKNVKKERKYDDPGNVYEKYDYGLSDW